jgi:hypothetical protein
MDELKYDFLTDVQGRWQADLLKSYFEAYGVEAELFQESIGQHIYPTTLDILGNVQIYVPKEQLARARKLLEEYYNPPPEEAGEKPKTARKPMKRTVRTAKPKSTKATPRKPK